VGDDTLSVTPPELNTEGLNKSDSIGFVGIFLGIIAISVDPTPPLKLGLLLVACLCSVNFIWKSHWTYKLGRTTKFVVTSIVVAILWSKAVMQVVSQIAFLDPALQFSSRLWLFMIRPVTRLFEAGILGAVIMLVLILFLSKVNASLKGRPQRKVGDKGFLDFKHETESAIAEIPVRLEPITVIVGQVGQMVAAETARILVTPESATRVHLRNFQVLARKLKNSTRKMEALCSKFELVGTRYAEGITGWSAWLRQQPGAEPNKKVFVLVVSSFAHNARAAMQKTDGYLNTFESIKGVSMSLNGAIDEHLVEVGRVRRVLEHLVLYSVNAIRGFESASDAFDSSDKASVAELDTIEE